jgi:hypothetical protein
MSIQQLKPLVEILQSLGEKGADMVHYTNLFCHTCDKYAIMENKRNIITKQAQQAHCCMVEGISHFCKGR